MHSMNTESSRQAITLGDTYHALTFVDSNERETWLRVGMAIKSEFGDNGFNVWDDWSRTGESYKAKDAQDVWKSFRGDGVTIATLIYEAKQNGWMRLPNYKVVDEITKAKTPPPPKPMEPKVDYAKRLWIRADWTKVKSHPYSRRKKFNRGLNNSFGAARGFATGKIIGENADCIIVPIRNYRTNELQAVQCINAAGEKQTFGRLTGGSLILGNDLDPELSILVFEGWASTVAWVFFIEKGNACAVCSFGKSNQERVGREMEEKYPGRHVVLMVEED